MRRAAAQADVQPALGLDPRRRDMEEGGRPRTECCSVRRLDFLPRLTVKVFRPNPVYNKMRFSGESEAAWHRQGTSQRGPLDFASGVQNDVVELRAGAVQREANLREEALFECEMRFVRRVSSNHMLCTSDLQSVGQGASNGMASCSPENIILVFKKRHSSSLLCQIWHRPGYSP